MEDEDVEDEDAALKLSPPEPVESAQTFMHGVVIVPECTRSRGTAPGGTCRHLRPPRGTRSRVPAAGGS